PTPLSIVTDWASAADHVKVKASPCLIRDALAAKEEITGGFAATTGLTVIKRDFSASPPSPLAVNFNVALWDTLTSIESEAFRFAKTESPPSMVTDIAFVVCQERRTLPGETGWVGPVKASRWAGRPEGLGAKGAR